MKRHHEKTSQGALGACRLSVYIYAVPCFSQEYYISVSGKRYLGGDAFQMGRPYHFAVAVIYEDIALFGAFCDDSAVGEIAAYPVP